MTETPTRTLIEKAKHGDRSALEALVESRRPALEAWIAARLGARLRGKIDVEDVLQDTVVRALKAIDGFRGTEENSFESWLRGIAGHVILYAAQKHRRDGASLEGDVSAGDTSPSKASRRQDRFDRLQRALDMLSPDHRDVIVLARIERLRIRDIAERMSRSEDAVKQLLARALRSLKHSFGDTESLSLPDRALRANDGKE
jgi:RNA polymerase sigma-70 factor (ECF subfamily)